MSPRALPETVERVAQLIARRTGLVFPHSRKEGLAAAVSRSLERTRTREGDQLLAALESSPSALEELVAELTIPESYFFRAPEQFEVLRREALPEILRRCGPAHRLRLLSAGCAGGEEPYSLAIVLEEEGLAGRSTVIGGDISRQSLARAAEASYASWSLRGASDAFRCRYFHPHRSRFVLQPHLRERVEFTWLNLAEDFHPSHATGIIAFDVIFCRNALIYFDEASIAGAARRLFNSLAEGGWLFTGASDPPLAPHAAFETVVTSAGIAYRRPPVAEARVEPAPDPWPALPAPVELPKRAAPPAAPAPPVDPAGSVDASLSHVRSLADGGLIAPALRAATEAARAHPSSAGIHFLRAVLLTEAGKNREAADVLRRALYLDGRLAVAALALGLCLKRLGDRAGARRALGQARALLEHAPANEPVAMADGEIAGRLLLTIDMQIGLLEEA